MLELGAPFGKFKSSYFLAVNTPWDADALWLSLSNEGDAIPSFPQCSLFLLKRVLVAMLLLFSGRLTSSVARCCLGCGTCMGVGSVIFAAW